MMHDTETLFSVLQLQDSDALRSEDLAIVLHGLQPLLHPVSRIFSRQRRCTDRTLRRAIQSFVDACPEMSARFRLLSAFVFERSSSSKEVFYGETSQIVVHAARAVVAGHRVEVAKPSRVEEEPSHGLVDVVLP